MAAGGIFDIEHNAHVVPQLTEKAVSKLRRQKREKQRTSHGEPDEFGFDGERSRSACIRRPARCG